MYSTQNFFSKYGIAKIIAILLISNFLSTSAFLWVVDKNEQTISDIKRAFVVDNQKQLEYLFKTNEKGKISIEGIGSTKNPVHFDFMKPDKNNYLFVSYVKQRYTEHTSTSTSNGKTTTTHTYSWDTIGSDSLLSPSTTILGHDISIQDANLDFAKLDLSPSSDMFNYGQVQGMHWYPTVAFPIVGNTRYSFDYVPNNSAIVISGAILNNNLTSLSSKTEKYLAIGDRKFLLEAADSQKNTSNVIGVLLIISLNLLIIYCYMRITGKYIPGRTFNNISFRSSRKSSLSSLLKR